MRFPALIVFGCALCGFSFATHAEPIHANLGAQPEAIVVEAAGEEPRAWAMPRGVAGGVWHYLLTIDRSTAANTGEEGAWQASSRTRAHVELLVEARANAREEKKTTYSFFISQACVDEYFEDLEKSVDEQMLALQALPQTSPWTTESNTYTREIPRTIGIKGTLVVADGGWIDALRFDYPDDVDPAALRLSLEIEHALRTLMPAVPAEPTGKDAQWGWSQYMSIDGLLTSVERTVTLTGLYDASSKDLQTQTVTLSQILEGSASALTHKPGVLMLSQGSVQESSVGMSGTVQSVFHASPQAAALPLSGAALLTKTSSATWTPEADADDGGDKPALPLQAASRERIEITIEQRDEPMRLFAEQSDEDNPAKEQGGAPQLWSRVEVQMARDFDGAKAFMSQLEGQLDKAIAGEESVFLPANGEGEKQDLTLPLVLNEPMRARGKVETMSMMELVVGTPHRIETSAIVLEFTLTLTKQIDVGKCEGTLLVTSASGSTMLAEREGDEPLKPEAATQQALDQDAIDALLGVQIPVTVYSNGGCVIEMQKLPAETRDALVETSYEVVGAVESIFQSMQPRRVVPALATNEKHVVTTGTASEESTASVSQFALATPEEGKQVRVLHEHEYLRSSVDRAGLFNLSPLIADTAMRTRYYHHLASEDSGKFVPARAKRGDIKVRSAKYFDQGTARNGRETTLSVMTVELLTPTPR